MREILFKAKRFDNGEWVEGYLMDEDYINIPFNELGGRFDEPIEIEPDTICQYTGLTDKNGKKIWENDILRGHGNDEDLVKVVFGKFDVINVDTLEVVDSAVGWHTEVIATDALSKCEPFCLPMPLTVFYIKRCEYEVFGNIFDDKELLEVE